jgi:hypothetical protein
VILRLGYCLTDGIDLVAYDLLGELIAGLQHINPHGARWRKPEAAPLSIVEVGATLYGRPPLAAADQDRGTVRGVDLAEGRHGKEFHIRGPDGVTQGLTPSVAKADNDKTPDGGVHRNQGGRPYKIAAPTQYIGWYALTRGTALHPNSRN